MESSTVINSKFAKRNITFIGIVTSPLKTTLQFRNNSNIKVIRPLFLLSIFYSIYSGIVAYKLLSKNNNTALLAKDSGTTEERIQIVGGIIGSTYTMLTIIFTIIIISIILKILSVFLGKDISFKKLLSIIIYSHVIPLLGLTINLVLSTFLGYEEIISFTNLSSIFHSKPLSAILETFDIFRIWQYVIIGMGMYFVAGWTKKQILILTLAFVTLTLIGIFSMQTLFESNFINL